MADDQPSAVAGVLRRPFAEQVAFWRGKLGRLVPTRRWDDLERQAHDSAFMVAGAQKADLLADLAAAVDRAIVEGKSLDAFRKDFDAAVDRHDWHGWTGEDTAGGRAWRTRTIYRANTSISYAAGRRAQLEAGNFAFWVYRHGGSLEPRPEHLALDGLALPPDHPFWDVFYPPSGWGCSCYVVGARSAGGVRRLGGDPDKRLPDDWRALAPGKTTPPGVDKGFDYAPGASVSGTVRAMAEKVRHWPYQIGKAYLGDLPAASRDAIGASYRLLPSVADDTRRYARRVLGEGGSATIEPVRTLGPVQSDRASAFADHLGVDASRYDYSLDPDAIAHVAKNHGNAAAESARGQRAVTIDDYAILPELVSYGKWSEAGTSWRTGNPLVSTTYRLGNIEYEATFERRKGRRSLALVTFLIRVRKL